MAKFTLEIVLGKCLFDLNFNYGDTQDMKIDLIIAQIKVTDYFQINFFKWKHFGD